MYLTVWFMISTNPKKKVEKGVKKINYVRVGV